MHEYSLVSALLDRVEEEARRHAALSVARVRLRVGGLAGVEPDLLRAAFEMAREGTICAAAELELVLVEVRWACRDCQRPIAAGALLACPDCGAPARLAEGDDLVLERLEMEVA
jgi:hydrogenase nickel incorporation protein HypA/HybF